MAIDQTVTPSLPDPSASPAIENEFPAYRAISKSAVLSLLFGLASVFCYADLWFLFLVAGSIILGLVSLKKIRELPEVITGASLARVGMGISLLFGLTSVTRVLSQDALINYDAGQFGRFFVGVLKDEPVSIALWYGQPLTYRKVKNPDDLVEELKNNKSPTAPDAYAEKSEPIVRIKERLKIPGEQISYDTIETRAVDGLTTYANALIKLEGPGSKDFPEKEQYLLLQLVKGPEGGKRDWVVQEIIYPYTPKSAVATVKKKDDDGHGHAH